MYEDQLDWLMAINGLASLSLPILVIIWRRTPIRVSVVGGLIILAIAFSPIVWGQRPPGGDQNGVVVGWFLFVIAPAALSVAISLLIAFVAWIYLTTKAKKELSE